MELTQGRAKSLLSYDPHTGILRWKRNRKGGAKAGEVAGYREPNNGYVQLTIDCKSYRAHRIAWLMVHGYIPENDVDHKNRIKNDNKIDNLREVSNKCNRINSKIGSSNNTGVVGVSRVNKYNNWKAFVKIDGKRIHIGTSDNFHEAVCLRYAAEQCLNWGGCDSRTSAKQHIESIIPPRNGFKEMVLLK